MSEVGQEINELGEGRCPSDPGSRATHGAASTAVSTVPASIPNAVWLVWGSQGEYSDRREWPLVAYLAQADAEAATLRMGELHRALRQIYRDREEELEAAGDWSGDTLYDTDPIGRELFAFNGGGKWSLGSYDDEVSLYCCEIELRAASGIEAPSGVETVHQGSTEGESPAPKGDAQ